MAIVIDEVHGEVEPEHRGMDDQQGPAPAARPPREVEEEQRLREQRRTERRMRRLRAD
ncbi:MAG TPA: hypothetical protein VFS21_22155 [Roseiflexaceae bacterium]|nr:hypothetical protein [Roseiflexaceae bacterium]